MDEGGEQKQVEEEEVVESTERSTRLSPVGKSSVSKVGRGHNNSLESNGDVTQRWGQQEIVFSDFSRKGARRRERISQSGVFLSTGKEGESGGRRPRRYQRGERVWGAATNLLFCFGAFLSSSFQCFFLV